MPHATSGKWTACLDWGTTFTRLVLCRGLERIAVVFPDGTNAVDPQFPSVVGVRRGKLIFGHQAACAPDSSTTIKFHNLKSLITQSGHFLAHRQAIYLNLEYLNAAGNSQSPKSLIQAFFKELLNHTLAFTGGKYALDRTVMAMPPNISDGFRKELIDWVKAAGWPDPKALYLEAEMRYYTAVYKEIQELGEEWALKKKRVSVIDFGGGTVVGLPKILQIGNSLIEFHSTWCTWT
jgi:molecular chaperone DnaK (HSP70)